MRPSTGTGWGEDPEQGSDNISCKLWDRLTRDWIVGKEAAKEARQHQFLGFVKVDSKVCSLRFRKEEDAVDLSIKQVGLLTQYEVRKVFHCDGLLVFVLKDESKLLAWNPYLGQTRSISPRTAGDDFHDRDTYLFGYDMNRDHKLLRFHGFVYEMYEFSSNSWRVLDDVTLPYSWDVKYGGHRYVSLKGYAYFLAQEITTDDVEIDVILFFDFTAETFGPQPLLLPFLASCEEAVTLSSVRDQKLALLHQKGHEIIEALEIWITTKIDQPFNAAAVTWSKFMKVDMRPLIGDRFVRFSEGYASFFIIGDEEEEKVAVVFDMDGYEFCFDLVRTDHYHTAFIIGDEGYYKTVSLGRAPNQWKPPRDHRVGGYVPQWFFPPLVCSSSYLPSLVQLNNQPRQRD